MGDGACFLCMGGRLGVCGQDHVQVRGPGLGVGRPMTAMLNGKFGGATRVGYGLPSFTPPRVLQTWKKSLCLAVNPILGHDEREWPYEITFDGGARELRGRRVAGTGVVVRRCCARLLDRAIADVLSKGWTIGWMAIRRRLDLEADKLATEGVFSSLPSC